MNRTTIDLADLLRESKAKAIRGENLQLLSGVQAILPISLGDRYFGVLGLGPLPPEVELTNEKRFLVEAANTIGAFALSSLEVIHLNQERERL